ncbi:GtrA family protein [Aquabacterium lacunae]|uniref:GtrA family protein n=2 Tax=Aquabacterium lacunae TaxID=2528630 RepID=A0A4Q9GZ34_9BURK|nr:GtrA family protein [Aquabacterium lacunae]
MAIEPDGVGTTPLTPMTRLFRFAVSGILAAAWFGLVLHVLLTETPWSRALCGALAYASAMPVGYLLHRRFTFRSNAPMVGEMGRFLGSSAAGMALASGITQALTAWHLPPTWTTLMASVCTPALTYVLSVLWVFRQRRKTSATASR